MTFDQSEFEVRCEWGRNGIEALGPISDVEVIVDVLSFSTAVDVAVGRGGVVLPFPLRDASSADHAASTGAVLASADRGHGFSLSPASLQAIPSGLKLALPSPHGAALCCSVAHATVITACLRNATASAQAAMSLGRTFALIPAGETWEDGSLRPAIEDLLGAGARFAAPCNSRPSSVWLQSRRT